MQFLWGLRPNNVVMKMTHFDNNTLRAPGRAQLHAILPHAGAPASAFMIEIRCELELSFRFVFSIAQASSHDCMKTTSMLHAPYSGVLKGSTDQRTVPFIRKQSQTHHTFCKLTWLVLGGDPAARSHRVEQFTAL